METLFLTAMFAIESQTTESSDLHKNGECIRSVLNSPFAQEEGRKKNIFISVVVKR